VSSGKTTRHSGLKPEKSSTSFDSYSISSVTPRSTGAPIPHLMVVREPPRLNRGAHLAHFLLITKATVIRYHPCRQGTLLSSVRIITTLLRIPRMGRPSPHMDGNLDCLLCIPNHCHLSDPPVDQCRPRFLPFVPTRPTSRPRADDMGCTRLVRPQTSCIQVAPVNSHLLRITRRRRTTMNCRRRASKNH
jgi:hypothetical protein